MKSFLVSRLWLFILALVVIFFVASIALSYRSIGIMSENNQAVTNSLQILASLKDLRINLSRAENQKRGFLITESEDYLGTFNNNIFRVKEIIQNLSQSPTSIEQQRDRFQLLYQHVIKITEEMQMTVGLVEAGRQQAAFERVKTNIGRQIMQTIDQIIDSMEADETLSLYNNRMLADQNRKLILTTLIAANVIGLLLSLTIFIVLSRTARKISTLYEDIERVNSELESKVEERTYALQIFSEELQRSNRELEDFAFVASHDLQEPLRKIRAFGDRLLHKHKNDLGESGADYVARMYNASERMSLLINDLLSFSRVTSRQKPFTPVDLNSVIAQAQSDLEYAIESNQAKILVDSLPTIDGDTTQLSQVFMNLLSNSIKFRRKDVTPEISIHYEEDDEFRLDSEDDRDWIRITYSDNGIGFNAQYADKIFHLFQRLHGREEYTGTGIGLSLCRKIIERHGGRITAESASGQGSHFFIILPTTQMALDIADIYGPTLPEKDL